MNIPILTCTDICKSYNGKDEVVSHLDFVAQSGRIIGLLGPNGCGKTTLIKMIAGLLVPDHGNIVIDGVPQSEKTNALVSYLPERPYFNSWMTVDQLLAFFSDFYTDFDEERARAMLADLGIKTGMKMKALSKGTKEKVQLILVMSRRAKLYLLDEPIAGVDPATRDYILETILKNFDPSASILITTHLISDIEQALDDFAFLTYGGRILRSGVVKDVREETGKTIDELFREDFRCLRN